MLKILFLGTDKHSGSILKQLINKKYQIVACVSQPNRIQGRKKQEVDTVVKQICDENNILCYQPQKIMDIFDELKNLDYDVMVCVAYGQIIPKDILDLVKYNLNVHYSLLPMYRGATPLQTSIANGDPKIGISIIQMVPKMDAGCIYAQKAFDLDEHMTTSQAFDFLNPIAADMLDELLKVIDEKNNLDFVIQNENQVSFCQKINNKDELIDFNQNVDVVYNKIRSLLSEPGCYFFINNQRYKIIQCTKDYDSSIVGCVSKIDKNNLCLGCDGGNIVVKIIQPSGKKPMPIKNFLNGAKNINVGDILNK